MEISDYVANFIANQKVKHIFLITGGAVFNLVDAIARNNSLEYICTEHEQAAAMAADAYSRVTKNLGVAVSTSGPGATNLITGVCCSWYDSIPTMFFSGQVSTPKLKGKSKIRQFGFQETDVSSLFKPITKYSKTIKDPQKIRYELEKANYLARNGRPGPILLDLPNDIQRAEINPKELIGYRPHKIEKDLNKLEGLVEKTTYLLENSERPIIIFGGGIRLANVESEARELIEKLNFPALMTWATKDLFPYTHPLVIEGFGVSSERTGNFAIQNSDLALALGTRLDTHETSDLTTFARNAKKIIVDVDKYELEKYEKRGMKPDLLINCDLRDFLRILSKKNIKINNISKWINKINEWKKNYPICLPEYYNQKGNVNPYVFMDELSKQSKEGDIIIPDAGGNLTWTMQGFRAKRNQRLFSAFNHSPMGYSLPASIGACFASGKKSVTCIIGDGGIQMNIHELATAKHHNLPIKIFLFNNQGYGIIRQTLENYMNSRYEAVDEKSAVPMPNLIRIANAYGIRTLSIKDNREIQRGVKETLNYKGGPILCDVNIHPYQKIEPKLISSRPLEECSPELPREVFLKEMIIKPLG